MIEIKEDDIEGTKIFENQTPLITQENMDDSSLSANEEEIEKRSQSSNKQSSIK